MNALHHSPLATSNQATIMETIMKPLSYARRPARWLMAAGLALAAMQTAPALSQPAAEPLPTEGLRLDRGPDSPHPDRGEALPFFTKIGGQRDCDYVVYDLRFGARGDPEKFLDPAFIAEPAGGADGFPRHSFRPACEIVDVQVSGDGTDAVGGPLPAATISTTTNPNDTATIADFRLSASRSRRCRASSTTLYRHPHHRQDRPCGFPRADGRRQPGLRHDHRARRSAARGAIA